MVHHGSDDEDDDDMLPHPEGDGEEGYSYGNDGGSSIPLVSKHAVEEEGDVIFEGDEDLGGQGVEDGEMGVVPYAHRDLKPGHVLLCDITVSLLMTFLPVM